MSSSGRGSFLLSSPRSLAKGLGFHPGKEQIGGQVVSRAEVSSMKPASCVDVKDANSNAMVGDKITEGYLFLRIHVRRRRYCVLRGRTLNVFDTKDEYTTPNGKAPAVAKKIITVVGVKDAMQLEKSVRASLLGIGNNSSLENALVISTPKSKLVVVEAETRTEQQRWLHAMSCLNFASSSSEKSFFLSILQDGASVDAHVAVSLLHKYRDNEVATELIIDRLAEYSERNIDDVEFYIQQIMHLVVNAEMTKTEKLVHLLLSICKSKAYVEHLGNCIHLALQLFWLLEAKIQDKDPKTYNLCAKLLMSIEAKVVNQQFELPSTQNAGDVSKLLMAIPGMKERLQEMTRGKPESQDSLHDGKVTSARPEEVPSPPHAGLLTIDTTDVVINTDEQVENSASTAPADPALTPEEIKQQRELLLKWMEKERQKRYKYFHQQRDFVKALTDISEKMRLIEPPQDRKKHLPAALEKLTIPEMAYIPLGRVTDPFCRITRVLKDEGTVFSTHSRAPCLLCFEVIEDHVNDAGHHSSSPKPTLSTVSPRYSRSISRRGSSASVCSSASSAPDEEADVVAFIKKFSINGKIICMDEHATAGGEDSTSHQEEATTLEELEKQLDITITVSDEPPVSGTSASRDGTLTSAASPKSMSSSSSLHEETSLVRCHSRSAYEFGLSKMLSESGVFGESWKEKKVSLPLSGHCRYVL